MAIERFGLPIVQITAVPTVARMIGVTRTLQGESIVNILGDINLTKEQEKELRRKYILRALDLLKMDVKEKQIFTLKGEH